MGFNSGFKGLIQEAGHFEAEKLINHNIQKENKNILRTLTGN